MKVKFPPPPDEPATRKAIAAYCQRSGYRASARTVERWPLPYRVIGNRATSEWPIVLAYLDERINGAPLHNAGAYERLKRHSVARAR